MLVAVINQRFFLLRVLFTSLLGMRTDLLSLPCRRIARQQSKTKMDAHKYQTIYMITFWFRELTPSFPFENHDRRILCSTKNITEKTVKQLHSEGYTTKIEYISIDSYLGE
jgi:hypothetical protein